MIKSREEAKIEIMENGVVELGLNNIDRYPEDDVDPEIMTLSLSLIAQAVTKQPKVSQLVLSKQGLNKIIVQFKLVLD